MKFDSVDDLKDWLRKRNVYEHYVDTAANKLMEQEFNESYSLLGISSSQLERVGFPIAKAMSLSTRLKPKVNPRNFDAAKRKSENDSTGERKNKLQRVGEMIVQENYPDPVQSLLSQYDGYGVVTAYPAWNRRVGTETTEPGNDESPSQTPTVIPMVNRDAYRQLSVRLLQDVKDRAVVTGMPGIGKSWFVEAFSSFLIKKGIAVILERDVEGSVVAGRRRVEIIVPRKDKDEKVVEVDVWNTVTDEKGEEILQSMDYIQNMIGRCKCWNLIDYRDKNKKPLLGDPPLNMKRVLFASPDRKRWAGFFVTDDDKGQEPTYIMPVWGVSELEGLRMLLALEEEIVKHDDLVHLVNLFGPSPRYCLCQFHLLLANTEGCVSLNDYDYRDPEQFNEENEALETLEKSQEAVAASATEENEEDVEAAKGAVGQNSQNGRARNDPRIEAASLVVKENDEGEDLTQSGMAQKKSHKGDAASGLKSKVLSSDAMLQNALVKLSSDRLRKAVKRAADIVKGRLMSPGVVEELQNIIESPTEASCSSSLSTRLLVWGVPGDNRFIGNCEYPTYARYASPYIATVVLEENSKLALRAMAKFFESGDKNVGAGSGWMYEAFILKYWLPILKQKQKFYLSVVGEDTCRVLEILKGYNCEAVGSVEDVEFERGTMYLPVARNFGAVDCFMALDDCLVAFQVTCGGSRSTSKPHWDEIKKKASSKGISKFWFVLIVPHWRVKNYSDNAQAMKDGGKLLLVKGPYKRDIKDTLLYSINCARTNSKE